MGDAELLQRWRGGDMAAGEALFDAYYDLLERFFANKIGNDGGDLVQDTFAACVAARDRVADDRKFRSYLFSIAYNVLRGYLRQRYRSGPSIDADELSVRDMGMGPSTIVAKRREQRLLLEGLRAIPLSYQFILELHYWEEMTSAEIAEILDIPVGTVKSRMRRARELLEQAMAQLAQAPELHEQTVSRLDDWAAACRRALP